MTRIYAFEDYLVPTARNDTQNYICITMVFRKLILLCISVLRNKAHETSAFRITQSWAIRPKCFGNAYRSKLHAKKPRIPQNIFLGTSISNNFVTKSNTCVCVCVRERGDQVGSLGFLLLLCSVEIQVEGKTGWVS